MKKLTLLFLFAVSLVAASVISADTKSYTLNMQGGNITPVWPSAMTNYRWPTQQMINQPRMPQAVPVYPNTSTARVMPRYSVPYQAPYNGMQQYPNNNMAYPPVLRYPANQTFQQARPVYNFNTPYRAPMAANPYPGQYAYPTTATVSPQTVRPPQAVSPQPQNMTSRPPYQLAFPAKKKPEPKKKKPWGDTRNIWPDFYTEGTGNLWDDMMNAPYDVGRMPGGWRAPSLSTPDPVTVGDAVTNQFPPVIDEIPNFVPLMN